MNRQPLRVSVIGIDGAGKSSTTLRAIDRLSAEALVCKPGRDAFVQQGGHREYCVPRISNGFERFFRRVDASRRRSLIGLSRIAFIAYQRWLEPYLIGKYRPSVVISTRCMIIDPSIYCDIYWPRLKRISLGQRMRAFQQFSGVPFRDLYIFLRTPASVALERIHRRVAQTPLLKDQPREYWLHLHESESILARLGTRFDEAFAVARTLADFEVLDVDTTGYDESAVAQIIADEIRGRLSTETSPMVRTCA